MPGVDELLRDAQYAAQNVGYGSTNGRKYAARAKSLARRIIRKHPDSLEATAATLILQQLGESAAVRQPRTHVARPASPSIATADDRLEKLTANLANRYMLPGWPLRFMQASSVAVGVIVVINGMGMLASPGDEVPGTLAMLLGGWLVFLPSFGLFKDLVGYVKSKVLINEDWYADIDDMPTAQDIKELAAAIQTGSSSRRLVVIGALVFFSGFALLFAAVIYVVGVRRAFDLIEGWLIERKLSETTNSESSPP